MSEYVRRLQRGPITDTVPSDATGKVLKKATSRCEHGIEWPEGGPGCVPCLEQWRAAWDGEPLKLGPPEAV